MSDLKTFLKVLSKVGYPNPNVDSIAQMVSYNLEEFLPDLVAEIGEDGANDFVEKALDKLSDGTKEIKININESDDEYAYVKFYTTRVDLDNDDTTVLTDWGWGDTRVLSQDEEGNETYVTMQQLYDNAGLGEMGELEDYWDNVKEDCSKLVYQNCGFGIWWDYFYRD